VGKHKEDHEIADRKELKRLVRRRVDRYLDGVKVRPFPTGCVVGDPHCECRVGQYCLRLPPPL